MFRFLEIYSQKSNQIRQLNTSSRFRRNFFNYEEFSDGSRRRPTPPKPPENFAQAYKRRPLFWMIRGTDVMKEHNRICLSIAGFSLIMMFLMIGYLSWRLKMDKDFFERKKILWKYQRGDTEERKQMFDLQKQLQELNLLSHFATFNIEDYGEIKPIDFQVNINFNNIFHEGNILQRKDIGRDLTQLSKNSSLKEVDEFIRQDQNKP